MIFKALVNLSHIDSREILPAGVFITDEGEFVPDDNIKQVGDVQIRYGWLTGRTQKQKNYLLFGNSVEMVDREHPDYGKLVDAGIVTLPKTDDKDKS